MMPMKHFTQDEAQPSQRTIDIIKAIAYTYRVMDIKGKMYGFCLN